MSQIILSRHTYESCKEEFIAFRNANRDTIRDAAYFDWRYSGRPNERKPIIIWAENGKGEKIGALSLIPHHYIIDNNVASVGLLGDISVAEEWRGKGVAQKMFRYLAETEAMRKLPVSLVLPNETASRSLEKADWRTISTLDRYVKFINIDHGLRRMLKVDWLSRLVALFVNILLKLLSLETYTRDSARFKGEIVDGFDERFDALWHEVKKDGMIIGLRNKRYLIWRYKEHPLLCYQIFTLTDNSKLCGYIVFHCLEDSCYVDDLFCFNTNKYGHILLTSFLRYARTI